MSRKDKKRHELSENKQSLIESERSIRKKMKKLMRLHKERIKMVSSNRSLYKLHNRAKVKMATTKFKKK